MCVCVCVCVWLAGWWGGEERDQKRERYGGKGDEEGGGSWGEYSRFVMCTCFLESKGMGSGGVGESKISVFSWCRLRIGP